MSDLAAEIRRVDGKHSLGAAALADALRPWLLKHDGEVRAKTLRGAAKALSGESISFDPAASRLTTLADYIERGLTDGAS